MRGDVPHLPMRLGYISVYRGPPASNRQDNVRVGVDSPEMPIPSTDSVASNNRSERESHHRMLIDADSPASSTAAASLL
jgi:hypothetical protein